MPGICLLRGAATDWRWSGSGRWATGSRLGPGPARFCQPAPSKSQHNGQTGQTERFAPSGPSKPSCTPEEVSLVTRDLQNKEQTKSDVWWRDAVTILSCSGAQEGFFSPFAVKRSVGPVGLLHCDLLNMPDQQSKSQHNGQTGHTEQFAPYGLSKPSCTPE